jgi:hypothetical protein
MIAEANPGAEPSKKTSKFKGWRSERPFIPGLLMICAGVVILVPAYLSLKILDLLVVISTISGVSTLTLGACLIMFGIGTWLKPATAPYLGVLSIIFGVVALPASNFGGFIIGTLLAIVGGATALGWESADHPRVKQINLKKREKKDRKARKKAQKDGIQDVETQDAASPFDDSAGARCTTAILVLVFTVAASIGGVATRPASAAEAAPLPPLPALPSPPFQIPEPPVPPTMPSKASQPELSTPAPPRHTPSAPKTPTAKAPLVTKARSELNNVALAGRTQPVTADEVTINGNVQVKFISVQTPTGPENMIELSGNSVVVNNIKLDFGEGQQLATLSSSPGKRSILQGDPVVIRTRALTATPTVAGVPTIPVTIDAQGNLRDAIPQLERLGFTKALVPDEVLQFVSLRDVKMDAYGVRAQRLEAPKVSLRAFQ